MDKNDIKQHIKNIITQTFKEVDRCYKENQEAKHCAKYEEGGSRLIFPCYSRAFRKEVTRISEQELRFLFIEKFTQYCNNPNNQFKAFYSVETPTEMKYKFSEAEKPEKDNNGRSAMMDVCIHDEKGTRLCLIEFKAGTPDGFCYVKDFVKLAEEIAYKEDVPESIEPKDIDSYRGDAPLRFFVHLLKKKGENTENSILERIKNYCENGKYNSEDMKEIVNDICFYRHYIEGETTDFKEGKAFFEGKEWEKKSNNTDNKR